MQEWTLEKSQNLRLKNKLKREAEKANDKQIKAKCKEMLKKW